MCLNIPVSSIQLNQSHQPTKNLTYLIYESSIPMLVAARQQDPDLKSTSHKVCETQVLVSGNIIIYLRNAVQYHTKIVNLQSQMHRSVNLKSKIKGTNLSISYCITKCHITFIKVNIIYIMRLKLVNHATRPCLAKLGYLGTVGPLHE